MTYLQRLEATQSGYVHFIQNLPKRIMSNTLDTNRIRETLNEYDRVSDLIKKIKEKENIKNILVEYYVDQEENKHLDRTPQQLINVYNALYNETITPVYFTREYTLCMQTHLDEISYHLGNLGFVIAKVDCFPFDMQQQFLLTRKDAQVYQSE